MEVTPTRSAVPFVTSASVRNRSTFVDQFLGSRSDAVDRTVFASGIVPNLGEFGVES